LKFTSRRNDKGTLSLGTCDVSIPQNHKVGSVERPSILRIEFREDPDKHFIIKSVTTKSPDEFYAELSDSVGHSARKEAFVFIHGFKVSFDDAVYRTAQISHDLQFQGAPILYSWPSNGKIYDYTPDINNNDWTVDHLEVFLKELVLKSGASVIHLVAHSMGNRALTSALKQMSFKRSPGNPEFNQVVLTAPDVDASIFTALAANIRALARRITLYVSSHDLALIASMKKNGSYPRAGDCGKLVVVVPGVIDTIDATAVDTNLIGHSYYAENRSVLSDVFNLFDADKDPPKRFGIRAVEVTPPYWRFAP
jgi:esterase/lipase superfamily enzyme